MSSLNPHSWVVHKFGGTSVGDADCMRKCIEIIRPLLSKSRVAVVLSAMGGKPKVTDLLLDMVHAAAVGNEAGINEKKQIIYAKHKTCIEDILHNCPEVLNSVLGMIDRDLKDISDLLRAVTLMKTAHEQILELVSGYGEVWSTTLLSEVMRQQGLPFIFVNARDVLFVSEDNLGSTVVHWDVSQEKLNQLIQREETLFLQSEFGKESAAKFAPVPVPFLLITGYIATSTNGVATTLKRDGSDFSASIFGKLLKATSITIWTDVSGVYSADPRRVAEATIIPEVSYNEAIELAYFGAKVIHPKTMAPAITDKIPIFIRNTFKPENPGTRIFVSAGKDQQRERSVCGFTSVDNIALLNIEGSGMIGVPGIAHRLFGALKSANISVMYIAQASSEYSICFATRSIFADKAKEVVSEAFFYELRQGFVSNINVIRDCAIIAAVGESMSNTPGVSGLFFGALGGASINILSISQGCDERNISAVVSEKDATRALIAVHSAFWLSHLELSVGIVGIGRVGSAVILSLLEQIELIKQHFGIVIRIRGVADSKKMLLGDDLTSSLKDILDLSYPTPIESPKPVNNVPQEAFPLPGFKRSRSNLALHVSDVGKAIMSTGSNQTNADLDMFYKHLTSGYTPHSLIIDATPSMAIANLHPQWLQGAHVVTANKRAVSSSINLYNAVYSAVKKYNKLYMSEVTIGASLPIRTTLHDMLSSGDAVNAIVGLMSVSAGAVLTEVCDHNMMLSQALSKTHATGLFEDDVFVDLEGTEAAQKLLILARSLGISLNIEDIEIEPIVRRRNVNNWADVSKEFAEEDIAMEKRARAAKEKGCTLRYVQRIVCDPPAELGSSSRINVKASVLLEEVPLDSPYAMVKGPLYYFAFHTARYAQSPLVIQGPLSDAANTASGILGDILRIAKSIGAKDKGPVLLNQDGISK